MELIATFDGMTPDQRRLVVAAICARALHVWEQYCSSGCSLTYQESVAGTIQAIDTSLPREALDTVCTQSACPSLAKRYQEPIVALQDLDLLLPEAVEFAYYAIYNAFRRYAQSEAVEEHLILNQALSALSPEETKHALAQALSAAV